MPIVVNTNAAATTAAFNLKIKTSRSFAKKLGSTVVGKPDNPACRKVVDWQLHTSWILMFIRTEAVLNNHQNALSYLQVQDGVLETMGSIVNRMSELRTMAADVTKNTSDVENYSKEFQKRAANSVKPIAVREIQWC